MTTILSKLTKSIAFFRSHPYLALFLTLTLLFTTARSASAGWVFDNNIGAAKDEAEQNEKLNMEGYIQRQREVDFAAWSCSMIGANCTADPELYEEFTMRSLYGTTAKTIAMVYANPPANTGTFLADAALRAGFVDKAYAQGLGYSALSPLIPIWRVFRNMTYVLIILVTVIVGFLIMLRRALDPQTVITIQNSLPRIVVTIILITFSYAIAGLVIDFMYFLILLSISVMGQTGLFNIADTTNIQQTFLTGGFWGLLTSTFSVIPFEDLFTSPGAATTGGGLVGTIASKIPVLGNLIKVTSFAGGLFGGFVLSFALELVRTGDPVSALGSGMSPFVILIVGIVFIFAFFRLLFMLIKAYIQILVNIIFAPIMLLADVLPGGAGFSNWITNLIGHALVFPITIVMILIGASIVENAQGGLWTPPLVPQITGRFMESLIGISIVLLIPSIVEQVQGLFKAAAPIGVSPGTIASPVARPLLEAQQYWYGLTGGALLSDIKGSGGPARKFISERVQPFKQVLGGSQTS